VITDTFGLEGRTWPCQKRSLVVSGAKDGDEHGGSSVTACRHKYEHSGASIYNARLQTGFFSSIHSPSSGGNILITMTSSRNFQGAHARAHTRFHRTLLSRDQARFDHSHDRFRRHYVTASARMSSTQRHASMSKDNPTARRDCDKAWNEWCRWHVRGRTRDSFCVEWPHQEMTRQQRHE